MAKVFMARYDGVCPDCGEKIEAGEEVAFEGDLLFHAECSSDPWYDYFE